MADKLFGGNSDELAIGIAKAALRVAGGSKFADAIADLTGLKATTVKGLAREALARISRIYDYEYRDVSPADRMWAEETLHRTYRALASRDGLILARESLVGAEALAAYAHGVGLSETDKADLGRMGEDCRTYYQLISHSMASLISSWYVNDASARSFASAAALQEVLTLVRDAQNRVVSVEAKLTEEPSRTPVEIWNALHSGAMRALSAPPDYYPDAFRNSELAASLDIVEMDEKSFFRFEGRGLYWGDILYGSEIELNLNALRPKTISVLLGDPGSGKSTFAKALVESKLELGEVGVYCRLEDFAYFRESSSEDPGASALRAFARFLGVSVADEEAGMLCAAWGRLAKRPLVVLDGLDELVTAAQYSEARSSAISMAESGYTVLITSRIVGYSIAWTQVHKHYGIGPLNPRAQLAFSDSWFRSTENLQAAARYRAATSDHSLQGVLSSPLTLGFVCLLSHYDHVPTSAAAVFNRFIDHYLRGPWRPIPLQRVDPGEVAGLRRHADSVAWAMAHYPRANSREWADIADLSILQRETVDEAPFATYGAGFLVPHGPVEPLGATQQRVRWLHRAIHENLVAQRLAYMVRANDSLWWNTLLKASSSTAWNGALNQTFALMNEDSTLDTFIDRCIFEFRLRDTPESHLANLLSEAAERSTHDETRERAARALIGRSHWQLSARLAPEATGGAIIEQLSKRKMEVDPVVWAHLYDSGIHNSGNILRRAAKLGVADDTLHWLIEWIRLSDTGDVRLDRLGAFSSSLPVWSWMARPLRGSAYASLCEALERCLREKLPPRLGLLRAFELWKLAVGTDRERVVSSQKCPYLSSAVALGFEYDSMNPQFPKSLERIAEPLSDLDVISYASVPSCVGCDIRAGDPKLLRLMWLGVRVSGGEVGHLVRHSSASQDLAIELVRAAARLEWEPNSTRNEGLLWALEILRSNPTPRACRPLSLLKVAAESDHGARLGRLAGVDAAYFINMLNSQPWHLLALQYLESGSGDLRWDAEVLCGAASLGTSRFFDGPTLPRDRCVAAYLEGIRRMAASSRNWSDGFLGLPYLEDLTASEAYRLAVEGLEVAKEARSRQVREGVGRLIELSLNYSNRKGEYIEMLRELTIQ